MKAHAPTTKALAKKNGSQVSSRRKVRGVPALLGGARKSVTRVGGGAIGYMKENPVRVFLGLVLVGAAVRKLASSV